MSEQTEVLYSNVEIYCITNLISFMTNEAEKLMKGSVYEDVFYIFHDALV